MIAFNDSDGNVTVVGRMDEWKRLFAMVDAVKIDDSEAASSIQYMMKLASSCNKFVRRRASDTN